MNQYSIKSSETMLTWNNFKRTLIDTTRMVNHWDYMMHRDTHNESRLRCGFGVNDDHLLNTLFLKICDIFKESSVSLVSTYLSAISAVDIRHNKVSRFFIPFVSKLSLLH